MVVGMASDGDQAVSLARRLRPDVVLLDIRMSGPTGLVATRVLTEEAPDVRVIVLTTFDLDEYVFDALCAGGFLLKNDARRTGQRRAHGRSRSPGCPRARN